jgi:hypothetical protein
MRPFNRLGNDSHGVSEVFSVISVVCGEVFLKGSSRGSRISLW